MEEGSELANKGKALVKVFKIEGTDFDDGGWRRMSQDHVQQERGCGTVRSAIRNCDWR